MKHYTETIPVTLAEKLKEKGMSNIDITWNPIRESNYCGNTYAEVFDWLMSIGYRIVIQTLPANEPVFWYAYIGTMAPDYDIVADTIEYLSWHEAANAAIEKALTLF